MGRGRGLTEKYKKEIAKKALEIKKKNPYLTWHIIAKRLHGVYDSSHLKKIIKKYRKNDV